MHFKLNDADLFLQFKTAIDNNSLTVLSFDLTYAILDAI
jgi:hypothetical protein